MIIFTFFLFLVSIHFLHAENNNSPNKRDIPNVKQQFKSANNKANQRRRTHNFSKLFSSREDDVTGAQPSQKSEQHAEDDLEFECDLRRAAFRYAPVLPRRVDILFDALELGTMCGMNLENVLALRDDEDDDDDNNDISSFERHRTNGDNDKMTEHIFYKKENDIITQQKRQLLSTTRDDNTSNDASPDDNHYCHELLVNPTITEESSPHPTTNKKTTIFPTIHHAIQASRHIHPRSSCKIITLPPGVTHLDKTIELNNQDTHLTIRGHPSGTSYLSGGTPLTITTTPISSTAARLHRSSPTQEHDELIIPVPPSIPTVESLFNLYNSNDDDDDPLHFTRYQRARYPNGDTERTPWGYASPDAKYVSLSSSSIREWLPRIPSDAAANVTMINLTSLENNPTGVVKNDSVMAQYNTYTSTRGGACSEVYDTTHPLVDGSGSYWCSTASGGGWAYVDCDAAKSRTVNIPSGLSYDGRNAVGKRMAGWNGTMLAGAVIHVWHGQSWYTNMFEVTGKEEDDDGGGGGVLRFGRGGSQGGRNWCRCDQCSYAADWCNGTEDKRLLGGDFYIENVREELDVPGEYYYDETTRMIHLLLNETDVITLEDDDDDEKHASPRPLRRSPRDPPRLSLKNNLTLIIPHLTTLLSITNTSHVNITNLGFQYTRHTYLTPHAVPSGGDWSLVPSSAALLLTNVSHVTISNNSFSQLDNTALMLTEYTRNVTIVNNEFAWLGASAMVAWGKTKEWDGRDGFQPRDTLVEGNVVREIGIYQKQSSAWFQAKSCRTTIRRNLFFNIPRAAVNFNDGFGGDNLVEENVMFNTCRESGDHGVINTWDRQPYLWDDNGDEDGYGYSIPRSVIQRNYLVANYGASQGVDNDDGSSFYHIRDNIHFGDGFKADYGAHDSIFEGNLVVVPNYDGQNCITFTNGFKDGHEHVFSNNTCVILNCRTRNRKCKPNIVTNFWADCGDFAATTFPKLFGNAYYTRNGHPRMTCQRSIYRIDAIQSRVDTFEKGSTFHYLPTNKRIVKWINDRIDRWKAMDSSF